MLNNISWASYVLAIGTITCLYYVFVFAIYYRKDIQGYFISLKTKGVMPDITLSDKQSTNLEGNKKEQIPDDQIYEQELFQDLHSLIKIGASRKFPVQELLLSVEHKLRSYPSFNEDTKNRINDYIITETQNNCSIHLTVDEVKVVWLNKVGGTS